MPYIGSTLEREENDWSLNKNYWVRGEIWILAWKDRTVNWLGMLGFQPWSLQIPSPASSTLLCTLGGRPLRMVFMDSPMLPHFWLIRIMADVYRNSAVYLPGHGLAMAIFLYQSLQLLPGPPHLQLKSKQHHSKGGDISLLWLALECITPLVGSLPSSL